MQGLSIAQGRQRPRSMKAVPIFIGPGSLNSLRPSRSSRLIGGMAAVGHRLPQAMQLCWHPLVPIRKLSAGVHNVSNPVSKPAGCITFVGQIRMHCPHLIHRERNAFSASAPGGRTRAEFQLVPRLPFIRRIGMEAAPTTVVIINCRRARSGFTISPDAEGAI